MENSNPDNSNISNHSNKCLLIIDSRESHVTKHVDVLSQCNHQVKQINIGDYAVIDPQGRILVAIERKSFDDFGASLKDGRHDNKHNLTAIRLQTGCRIIYIIEGPAFPNPTDCFARISYSNIESSIFHLQVRDNISIIRTKDTLDTAETLVRFMRSMDTLYKSCDGEIICEYEKSIPTELQKCDALSELTARREKTDDEIVREIWACIGGITVETAIDFMRHWSIADIVSGKIELETIIATRMSNGRTINKKAVNGLCDITKLVEIKMLQAVPGISRKTAIHLLTDKSLSRLLSYNKEMSIEIIAPSLGNKPARRLGDKMAEKIMRYFSYKYVPKNDAPKNNNVPPINTLPNIAPNPRANPIGVDDVGILNTILDNI